MPVNPALWAFGFGLDVVDGTTWVNTTSMFKYMYTSARANFARMLKTHFETCHIPHKLLEVQGVRTIFLF
jgi:hypothetical protein